MIKVCQNDGWRVGGLGRDHGEVRFAKLPKPSLLKGKTFKKPVICEFVVHLVVDHVQLATGLVHFKWEGYCDDFEQV